MLPSAMTSTVIRGARGYRGKVGARAFVFSRVGVPFLFFFFASACRHLRVEVRVFAGALPIRFSLLHIKV